VTAAAAEGELPSFLASRTEDELPMKGYHVSGKQLAVLALEPRSHVLWRRRRELMSTVL
jgi:hypothetical protein